MNAALLVVKALTTKIKFLETLNCVFLWVFFINLRFKGGILLNFER